MPPLIVTDSSYEFVPPHQGRIWPRLLSRFSTRMIRTRYGVHSVEIRDQQKLATLLADGHGIVLAPNHCRMADAMVLQSLSQSLHQPFFIMASSHLFRGNRLIKWALRRIGAFSVYREGADRKAVETAVDIIVQNKRPLVLFPEGALSHANDRLNALMEGVSFIARTAARKRQKADGDSKSVCIVPVAIRYLFQGDLVTAAGPILADIERRLSWRTQDNMPIVERVYKVGNALLGLKETEYLGGPRPGHIADRLQALIDALLLPLEHEWLKSRNDDSVINRVKKLRQAVVPGMICEDEPATERTPLPSEELDRRWRQLQDMQFAQALSLYPREYIASRPTVDRILETVERMAENLSGKEQVSPPLKAIIQVGDPIPVAAKRERGTDGDPVLNQLEASLSDMLNSLSRESTLCSDHQAAS